MLQATEHKSTAPKTVWTGRDLVPLRQTREKKATKHTKRKSLLKDNRRARSKTDLEIARDALPFFKKGNGSQPTSWWNVKPTGNYVRDYITGCRYAGMMLPLMRYVAGPPSLGWVISHMQAAVAKRRGRRSRSDKWSGIEVGFVTGLGDLIVAGLASTALVASAPKNMTRLPRIKRVKQDEAFKLHEIVARGIWDRAEVNNKEFMQP